MKKYYYVHPEHLKKMDTKQLRDNFLVQSIMIRNKITFNYIFEDRNIAGGIYVEDNQLIITNKESRRFRNREIGFINIAGEGTIDVDGVIYKMDKLDCLYVTSGFNKIIFKSDKMMKLYYNSAVAYKTYKNKHIKFCDAFAINLGNVKTMNKRTIYQYIHPQICDSYQLLMGLTVMNEVSNLNTFPPHIHYNRMETYFYFDLDYNERIIQMFGEVDETKHLILKNEEMFYSPSYCLHFAAATSSYSFIWAMLGENKDFDDIEKVEVDKIK